MFVLQRVLHFERYSEYRIQQGLLFVLLLVFRRANALWTAGWAVSSKKKPKKEHFLLRERGISIGGIHMHTLFGFAGQTCRAIIRLRFHDKTKLISILNANPLIEVGMLQNGVEMRKGQEHREQSPSASSIKSYHYDYDANSLVK